MLHILNIYSSFTDGRERPPYSVPEKHTICLVSVAEDSNVTEDSGTNLATQDQSVNETMKTIIG